MHIHRLILYKHNEVLLALIYVLFIAVNKAYC